MEGVNGSGKFFWQHSTIHLSGCLILWLKHQYVDKIKKIITKLYHRKSTYQIFDS